MRTLQIVLNSLVVAIILGKVMIPYFQRLKVGQSIREDGPQSHLSKAGTPTMGGFIFILAIVSVTLLHVGFDKKILIILAAMLAFGGIGFADDYIKVVLKRNLGLNAKQKIIFQLVFSVIMTYVGYTMDSTVWIPFTGIYLELGLLYIPLLMFVIVAVVNAVNLTDGLDGLNTSVTIGVFLFYFAFTFAMGDQPLNEVTIIVIAALFGFLLFNKFPAKVFMGDLGSMGLGGLVVGFAMVTNTVLLIPIVGLIYFAETVSVIIQVIYFKKTGKRFFKMAPLHHHYEHYGWSEVKIVTVFTGITLVMGILGYCSILPLI